ncbi:FG-GAP repeat domain-containing protein [Streptomyces puniciscabiei]
MTAAKTKDTKGTTPSGAAYPRIDDTNLSGDHKADLFVREHSTSTGYEKDSKGTFFASRISWGSFSGYNTILQTDLDRDGYQDFVLRRSSDGAVFCGQYNALRGHGDLDGDGKADLIARQSGTDDVYLYRGTGKAGSGAFASRVKVRSGWTGYSAFDAVGDVTGDGKADFLARTSGGTLHVPGHRQGDRRDLRHKDLRRHRIPGVRHLGLKSQVSEAHRR